MLRSRKARVFSTVSEGIVILGVAGLLVGVNIAIRSLVVYLAGNLALVPFTDARLSFLSALGVVLVVNTLSASFVKAGDA
jgi:hypothetical protein